MKNVSPNQSIMDAPRAGGAEAKKSGSIVRSEARERCTPCRRRRGKALCFLICLLFLFDAPRAGGAEAKCGLLPYL